VKLFSYRKLGGMEEVPGWSIDNHIWSIAEDINN
jgi:hypothetical protein